MLKSLKLLHYSLYPAGAVIAAFCSNILIIAEGESMQPTINPPGVERELLFVDIFSPVQLGDVVILQSPDDPETKLCKRIKGLGGDIISPRKNNGLVIIPAGYCWVEGDNANASCDSNLFGVVPQKSILGHVKYSLFPSFRKIKNVMNYRYEQELRTF